MERNKKPIKKSLGRGIDALISSSSADEINAHAMQSIKSDNAKKIVDVDITHIFPNPFQPRRYFDEEKLQELSDSIQQYGILEPILIRKIEKNKFHIIAGERRFRASKLANIMSVPAIILSVSDAEQLEIAIVENLQRENLNPIEMAISFKDMMALGEITQESLAKKLGISRPVVSNFIRLLTLPEEIQTAIKEKIISQSHARLLLSIENITQQKHLFQEIVDGQLSVKSLEESIAKTTSGQVSKKASENNSAKKKNTLRTYEQKFIEFFGTKVSLKGDFKKGTIAIDYFNQEDFSRILELLNIRID